MRSEISVFGGLVFGWWSRFPLVIILWLAFSICKWGARSPEAACSGSQGKGNRRKPRPNGNPAGVHPLRDSGPYIPGCTNGTPKRQEGMDWHGRPAGPAFAGRACLIEESCQKRKRGALGAPRDYQIRAFGGRVVLVGLVGKGLPLREGHVEEQIIERSHTISDGGTSHVVGYLPHKQRSLRVPI